jgi:hypothetical protein
MIPMMRFWILLLAACLFAFCVGLKIGADITTPIHSQGVLAQQSLQLKLIRNGKYAETEKFLTDLIEISKQEVQPKTFLGFPLPIPDRAATDELLQSVANDRKSEPQTSQRSSVTGSNN